MPIATKTFLKGHFEFYENDSCLYPLDFKQSKYLHVEFQRGPQVHWLFGYCVLSSLKKEFTYLLTYETALTVSLFLPRIQFFPLHMSFLPVVKFE